MKLKETRRRYGKSKQRKVVRVELRAAEGLHKPEKSEKSAGDMESLGKVKQQEPTNQHHKNLPQVLLEARCVSFIGLKNQLKKFSRLVYTITKLTTSDLSY